MALGGAALRLEAFYKLFNPIISTATHYSCLRHRFRRKSDPKTPKRFLLTWRSKLSSLFL